MSDSTQGHEYHFYTDKMIELDENGKIVKIEYHAPQPPVRLWDTTSHRALLTQAVDAWFDDDADDVVDYPHVIDGVAY